MGENRRRDSRVWLVGLELLFWAWIGDEIALAQPQIDGVILSK